MTQAFDELLPSLPSLAMVQSASPLWSQRREESCRGVPSHRPTPWFAGQETRACISPTLTSSRRRAAPTILFPTGTMTAVASSSSSSTDASLGSAIFARLHPATYLSRFLASSIRPDGRSLDAFRSTTIALSTVQSAQGSCIVRQGSTVFVAGIKGEFMDLGEEDAGEESEEEAGGTLEYGLGPADRKRLVVGVELSPMASAHFKPGPPGEESQVLTSRLMSTLESCPPLNRSSLVIARGVSSWCLYVDLVCLSFDGNAHDAALLAINGALRNARLPHAFLTEEGGQTVCSPDASSSKPLALTTCPLSCSFGIVEGTYLLSDPDAFESSLVASTIVVTLDMQQSASSSDNVVDIHCTGVCSARISHREAARASVEGSGDEQGQVWVKDEELVAVCLLRAQQRCAEIKSLLDNGR